MYKILILYLFVFHKCSWMENLHKIGVFFGEFSLASDFFQYDLKKNPFSNCQMWNFRKKILQMLH